MIDNAAGLRQLILPAGAQPGTPRILLGPDIPAELVAWAASKGPGVLITFYAVEIFYLDATQYEFHAIGKFDTLTCYFEGTYDPVNTVYVTKRDVLSGGAGTGSVDVRIGSNTLNTFPINYTFAQMNVTVDNGTFTVGGGAVGTASRYFNSVSMTPGTTVGAVYGDMPGSPGVTITKAYGPAVTSLEVHVYGTFFASGAAAGIDVGVAAGVTGDVNVTGLRDANSALASHTPFAGVVALTGLAAGNHTITGRWRKNGGAGTAAVDARDVFSMSVREVSA